MADRYKLLKDLPDSKAGDIYEWVDSYPAAYYKDGNINESFWLKESVQNNPDWFKMIQDIKENYTSVLFNNGRGYAHCYKLFVETMKKIGIDVPILYTEGDITQARIDAFNAARKTNNIPRTLYSNYPLYENAEVYLQSLSNK